MRFSKGGYQVLDLTGIVPGTPGVFKGAYKACGSGKPIFVKGVPNQSPFYVTATFINATVGYSIAAISYTSSGGPLVITAVIAPNDTVRASVVGLEVATD